MIAVVDRHADRGVVIGAAAAAGESGRFVHYDVACPRRSRTAAERPASPAPTMWTVPLIKTIAQHDEMSLHLRQAHGGARRSEAARDQGIENGAIGRPMMRGARTTRRGFFAMIAWASREMLPSPSRRRRAGFGDGRTRHDLGRVGRGDAGRLQRLARQIEAPERGVFVEVAQNVGELQRAAEMMRERNARVRRHAEHAHRKASDRASDPVAIEVERGAVRRADIGDHSISMPSMMAMKSSRLRSNLRTACARAASCAGAAPLRPRRYPCATAQLRAPQVARTRSSAISSTARQNE